MSIQLLLNQSLYQAGDEFRLECSCYNPGYEAVLDRYIILDVYGSYYFWPEWGQVVDSDRCVLPEKEHSVTTVLAFTWPAGVVGQASDLRFWGGLMWPGTTAMAADITSVSFGYE
jgi:hypothetical protein